MGRTAGFKRHVLCMVSNFVEGAMSRVVYHFTDTARLPWIIKAAELRPESTAWVGDGWPAEDYFWATTNDWGEPSAASNVGRFLPTVYPWVDTPRHVRFTLSDDDFEILDCETIGRAAWGPRYRRLKRDVEKIGLAIEAVSKDWRVRIDPLPLSRVIRIATRAAEDDPGIYPWVPFKRQDLYPAGGGLCVNVAGTLYGSTRKKGVHGEWIYTPIRERRS
jgi:hypothetical protein